MQARVGLAWLLVPAAASGADGAHGSFANPQTGEHAGSGEWDALLWGVAERAERGSRGWDSDHGDRCSAQGLPRFAGAHAPGAGASSR